MQQFSDFFTFATQCCDAEDYLNLGQMCAATGNCYDHLRPMGGIYWFSIPFRLGIDPSALIVGHLILTIISILLSSLSIGRLLKIFCPVSQNKFIFPILVIGSVISHAVFLYPVFWNALSDLPASLFFLIGCWLLIIFHTSVSPARLYWIILAGLCLGISVWIRIFFLYPVLVFIFIRFICTFYGTNNRKQERWLLIAIVPLVIQVVTTYERTGFYTFIDPRAADFVGNIHLLSDGTGYDTTLVPNTPSGSPQGYFWHSACGQYLSPKAAIHAMDIYSLSCLLTGKINFYLGSYAPSTYNIIIIPRVPDFDIFQKNENIHYENFLIKTKMQMTPNRTNIASGLWKNIDLPTEKPINETDKKFVNLISKKNLHLSSEIFQKKYLKKSDIYSFGIWLWSEHGGADVITLFFRKSDTGEMLVADTCLISRLPNPAYVMTEIKEAGMYDIGIQVLNYGAGTPIGDLAIAHGVAVNQEAFFAWDPYLLRDNPAYPDLEHNEYMNFRLWSRGLLFIHILVFISAILLIIKMIKTSPDAGWSILILMSLACGMGIAIVPEQRFFIAPMIAAWIFFFAWISIWVVNRMRATHR